MENNFNLTECFVQFMENENVYLLQWMKWILLFGIYQVLLQLFIHFKIGHSHVGIVNISGANISHFVHFWLADTSMPFTTMLMKIARQGTQCISIDVLAGFCAVETGLPCGTKYISPSLHSLKCLHANI